MFRGVAQLNLDAKGRMAIPAKYRDEILSSGYEFAGLNKEVALVGQGAKFELWDAAQWKFRITNTTFDGGDIPPELKGFSL